ncbi:MAG: hypothetical protein ABI895_39265, partial [Deltaproteobacteria bacterium]
MNIQSPRTSLYLLPLLLTSAALSTGCSSDGSNDGSTGAKGDVQEIVYTVRQHTTIGENGQVKIHPTKDVNRS